MRGARIHRPTGLVRAGTVLVLVILAACSPFAPDGGPTLLRVQNGTGWNLEELQVLVSPPIQVPALPAEGVTEYFEVDTAYRIATLSAVIDGLPHTLQVIDFVGEVPLGPGRFTYRLELSDGPGSSLGLTLIEDD